MAKVPSIWPIEPHTQAKHALLAGYLDAWYPILASRNRRIVIIDGFAGPGIYAGGEPGSPRIALERLISHTAFASMNATQFVFLFNEQDPVRHASLAQSIAELQQNHTPWPSNVVLAVEGKDFQLLAQDLLAGLGGKAMAPTFAFLDPFGYRDVPIELVRDLVAFNQSELFIYFDYNSVNRFATAGVVDHHFDALFGTNEYRAAPPAGARGRGAFLHDLYKRQLHTICGFPYVQSFEMVNSSGHTGNYLFFCTRHLKGFDRMKAVMWKIDPLGGYRFSDLLAGQEVLFQPDVDTRPLQSALAGEFGGRTISIEDVTNFVVGHTPYTSSHVKTRTLRPMQLAGVISSPNQTRTGQFPPGTMVAFRASGMKEGETR
ncbi:MAG: three-Cys-motif partner protein TcmP [Microbacterium sp.]|uniref:three-Cys-motif partner protein TcmP n=1 Tax=Microbacterium sp. TaxID=51671 RepID=UPI0019B9EBA7|nr:three-Cys-motif partner protein TcmP [Microbacterium sp.]MBD3757074.1 three-Cys-motif partner protein TcmP [Microbacterium sp.]